MDKAMETFFPKCRHKHPLQECMLNSIDICALCEQRHATKDCPLLSCLKAVYEEKIDTELA